MQHDETSPAVTFPADFARVVDAWAELPAHLRAVELALVDSHGDRGA